MYPPLSDTALHDLLAYLAGADDFVFLETTRAGGADHQSLLFHEPLDRLCFRAGDDVADFFRQVTAHRERGRYLAGWFAYEFGYLLEPVLAGSVPTAGQEVLAELGVYGEPHVFDHQRRSFTGAGPWPGGGGQREIGYRLDHLRLNLEREDYLAAIARIKQYIEAGDTYQVNFTLKLLFDFAGSAEAFYVALRRNQSVGHGAYLRHGDRRVLSFSPELFFRKDGEVCTVRPMKGTVRRGRTCAEDGANGAWLRGDIKNRSENVMIVDLLRNDLGRVCRMGSVQVDSLFDVETYESLHQMTSTIHGRLRPEAGLAELFRALFPCGSVTGAPKIRTMEIIRELETAPRGVYTGAIGYLAPNGDAAFSVPIRTVALCGEKGEMGIGSGVVYDSDPVGEWEECRLKGRFLTEPRPPFLLIETLLQSFADGYWLLDLHLDRLAGAAGFFGYPFSRSAVRERLAAVPWGKDGEAAQRVRLTLAKDGTLEVAAVPCALPQGIGFGEPDSSGPLPQICISAQAVDSRNVFLYHKTTRRELFDAER
ncbi:MAG: aminodeoxychorismate synthase component I, partial [Desulfobulbaceae bacterium]|nr:aminodeoxychorismate synthase component I [Desulfobulbaceae bacterium]